MVKFMAQSRTSGNVSHQNDEGCCKNSRNKCWGCSENCGCGCGNCGQILCTTTWLVAITASLASCAVNAIFWKRPEMLGFEKVGASADIETEETLTKIQAVKSAEEGMGGCAQFFLISIVLAILAVGAFFGRQKFTEEMKKQRNPAHATSMAQRYKAADESECDSEDEELRGTPNNNRRGKRSEALSEATSFSMFSDDESTQEARAYM